MKKVFIGLILLIGMTACTSTPADYFDEVTQNISEAREAVKTLESKREGGVTKEDSTQLAEALADLKDMKAYDKNDSLRQAAIDYVECYSQYYTNSNRCYELARKQVRTLEEDVEYTTLLQEYTERNTIASIKLIYAEKSFMKKYDLNAEVVSGF